MHVGYGDNPRGSDKTRFGKFALYTLLRFSLIGLVAGFAFGGFIGHFAGKTASAPGSSANGPTIPHQANSASATAGPRDVQPGDPVIGTGDYIGSQKADGSTNYKLSAQIINKNGNTPITATDVTCRLWLTNDANATSAALSADNYAIPRTIASFAQPFPSEVASALNFAVSSQQTQPCSPNSKTIWTYTLSTTVQPGDYYLVVLSDWKGVHYNWYMVSVKVTQ